ncbi:MAG TPA: hypothetical protein VIV07_07630, partial [Sphingomicrobium sp.]
MPRASVVDGTRAMPVGARRILLAEQRAALAVVPQLPVREAAAVTPVLRRLLGAVLPLEQHAALAVVSQLAMREAVAPAQVFGGPVGVLLLAKQGATLVVVLELAVAEAAAVAQGLGACLFGRVMAASRAVMRCGVTGAMARTGVR